MITEEGRAVPGPPEGHITSDDLTILTVLSEGPSMPVAAARLHMSPRTLRRRVVDLCDRLGVDNQVQAVVWAIRRDLI